MLIVKRAAAGFFAALVISALPVAAAAQSSDPIEVVEPEFDCDCMDDYGRNLCDRARWSAIVSSFGIEPAERVQQQGWRGVRVFTVNGYSHDMPMVSVFNRGVDDYLPIEPVLEVRSPVDPEDPAGTAPLRREAWFGL